MKIYLTALPIAALLSGCVSLSDKQISRFDAMSCSQLAVALDYEKRGKREADTSSTINTVASVLTKGRESDEAAIDSVIDDLDADEHGQAIDYIRDRQDWLDC